MQTAIALYPIYIHTRHANRQQVQSYECTFTASLLLMSQATAYLPDVCLKNADSLADECFKELARLVNNHMSRLPKIWVHTRAAGLPLYSCKYSCSTGKPHSSDNVAKSAHNLQLTGGMGMPLPLPPSSPPGPTPLLPHLLHAHSTWK